MVTLTRRIAILGVVLLAGAATAQDQSLNIRAEGEWHFARLVYQGANSFRGRSRFATDYPEAEVHLRQGLDRLTRVQTGPDTLIELDDDDIMNYPWLYAVEVGYWYLNDSDAALIREYLLRGGFLLVDDFHGPDEWAEFAASMGRVFPSRPIVDIPVEDEVFHVLFDLDQRTQIPGRGGQRMGTVPHWRGIFDEDNRLMVAINFNMDMGDAWEHADDPRYPEPFTGLAYRFAVNYVIYSMTH